MTAQDGGRVEFTALDAEYRRLVQVSGVLGDISDAAFHVASVKGFRDASFEEERWAYGSRVAEQAGQERIAAWDRVLVARYGETRAAEIQAQAKANVEQRLEQIRRERQGARDVRRSR
ncbi:hypothetical protein [Nocardia arthritidis]|uniref:Uncharacterized protein n=1 Tax=Nocardia arthritidis TaxID=228602 RepID=A0A6G9YL43_9NOCA|nr:hypothetical protein [Nocardia arthritidis]QIS13653.1 hypothetical protein F5544_29040 [Nocardia arthritidis]